VGRHEKRGICSDAWESAALTAPRSLSIDDALPADVAVAVRKRFLDGKWRQCEQENPLHYGMKPLSGNALPGQDEIYQASFSRDSKIEKDEFICDVAKQLMRTANWLGFPCRNVSSIRAYRLDAGNFFRMHSDNEIANVSFVYYLSENWRWDWGGLLLAVEDVAKVYLPKFNSMVVMDAKSAVPHTVTQVAPWAKEPRYMLAGFCQ